MKKILSFSLLIFSMLFGFNVLASEPLENFSYNYNFYIENGYDETITIFDQTNNISPLILPPDFYSQGYNRLQVTYYPNQTKCDMFLNGQSVENCYSYLNEIYPETLSSADLVFDYRLLGNNVPELESSFFYSSPFSLSNYIKSFSSLVSDSLASIFIPGFIALPFVFFGYIIIVIIWNMFTIDMFGNKR